MLPSEIPGLIKSEEWHRRRARCIGSSDWNHLLAGNDPLEFKYWCLRRLYYEKNMTVPDYPEFISPLSARGTFLEDKVLEMFKIGTGCKYTGGKQKRAKYACPGILLPDHWRAQPDKRAKFPEEPDVIVPVEAKTMGTGSFNHYKEHGLSTGYQLQCQSHNAQQESDLTWLVVGYFGDYLDFQPEPLPRDNDIIDKMVQISTNFWNITRVSSTPPPRPMITPDRCGECRYRLRCLGTFDARSMSRREDLSDNKDLYDILAEVERLRVVSLDSSKKKAVLLEKARQLVQSSGDPALAFCREFQLDNSMSFTSSFDRQRLESEDIHTARRYIVSEARQSFTSKITKRSGENWEARNR